MLSELKQNVKVSRQNHFHFVWKNESDDSSQKQKGNWSQLAIKTIRRAVGWPKLLMEDFQYNRIYNRIEVSNIYLDERNSEF